MQGTSTAPEQNWSTQQVVTELRNLERSDSNDSKITQSQRQALSYACSILEDPQIQSQITSNPTLMRNFSHPPTTT